MNKKSFGKIGVWHSDGNHADAKLATMGHLDWEAWLQSLGYKTYGSHFYNSLPIVLIRRRKTKLANVSSILAVTWRDEENETEEILALIDPYLCL